MMYGRDFFNNGFYGDNGCLGYGLLNNGWHMFILIGSFLTIALLIYFFVHNKKKRLSNHSSLEMLKMKYVQGDITEEEYLKRKQVLDRV